jgi:hypothetical protein
MITAVREWLAVRGGRLAVIAVILGLTDEYARRTPGVHTPAIA